MIYQGRPFGGGLLRLDHLWRRGLADHCGQGGQRRQIDQLLRGTQYITGLPAHLTPCNLCRTEGNRSHRQKPEKSQPRQPREKNQHSEHDRAARLTLVPRASG